MIDLNKTYQGDCREVMTGLISQGFSAQVCITSPPFWGQKDYRVKGQIGLEKSYEEYVSEMVQTFSLVRDVLCEDGTLWLHLGDSYYNYRTGHKGGLCGETFHNKERHGQPDPQVGCPRRANKQNGLKEKSLVGIPWRVALALISDGWILRSDCIWHRPNPRPESVKDRPHVSHDYLFMFTKSSNYYYDREAVKEPSVVRGKLRDRRTVWTVPVQSYRGGHFAVFTPKLIEPCVLASSRPNDTVFDPFMGVGTTAGVAVNLGRRWLGCELNPEYILMQEDRISSIVER